MIYLSKINNIKTREILLRRWKYEFLTYLIFTFKTMYHLYYLTYNSYIYNIIINLALLLMFLLWIDTVLLSLDFDERSPVTQ